MRESLLRRCGPERYSDLRPQRSTNQDTRAGSGSALRVQVSRIAGALFIALLLPAAAIAQSPWERAASNLEQTFTGPLARSLALDPELAETHLALGVVNKEGRPQIVINLGAAKDVNATFEPAVLKLARVVQGQ